uniref:Uncharacterized protein n=1 Tax=Salix viminalis TaxID=40686 RepID=A0A6N2MPN1_SALVM
MASATLLCWFSSDLTRHDSYSNFFARQKVLNMNQTIVRSRGCYNDYQKQNKFFVCAATEGSAKSSKSEETVPSWAKPDSDEPPPWAKGEGKENSPKQNFEVPFSVYLPASAITAIAATAFFTLHCSGFFAFTGIPTSAFLWFKSVQAANKEAEEQDKS